MGDPPRVYRGSRKHILDWVESPGFVDDLRAMTLPVKVVIPSPADFMPRGYASPREARLDQADTNLPVLHDVRRELRDWWLVHKAGANTPNWDLAAACEIEGKSGLVFVEAKANWPELQVAGKPLSTNASTKSKENHDRIRMAVSTARDGLEQAGFRTAISIDSHYQLANRIAFMWKLATLCIPTVLIYLGFTGDDGISDAGRPFADAGDWNRAFNQYARDVVPADVVERRLNFGTAPAWILVRSRPVLHRSLPR